MTTFWSCHLRTLTNDCRHVRGFIDADFFCWEGISILFLEWAPSTNANIFSQYYAHFGKTLNISSANDSTFMVLTNYVLYVVT